MTLDKLEFYFVGMRDICEHKYWGENKRNNFIIFVNLDV